MLNISHSIMLNFFILWFLTTESNSLLNSIQISFWLNVNTYSKFKVM